MHLTINFSYHHIYQELVAELLYTFHQNSPIAVSLYLTTKTKSCIVELQYANFHPHFLTNISLYVGIDMKAYPYNNLLAVELMC